MATSLIVSSTEGKSTIYEPIMADGFYSVDTPNNGTKNRLINKHKCYEFKVYHRYKHTAYRTLLL